MKMTKRKYVIPVSYEMTGLITIEAESASDAAEIAEEQIDKLPLPMCSVYADGSYKVETEKEIIECYTKWAEELDTYPEIFTSS